MSAPEGTIAGRLGAVRASLHQACLDAGRDPATVRLLAASKTKPAADVAAAIAAGHGLFGENRAQELRDKHDALPQAEWHFIGPLQKNKVRLVVGRARLIHSVDSLALAEAISARATGMAARGEDPGDVHILLNVNLASEESKSGVHPDVALDLAAAAHALPRIEVAGLMAIPPFCEDPTTARPWFEQLAQIAQEGRAQGLSLGELSMGMSHDHAVAIACGATIIRVGSAIFGSRG
jgi:pyridoxal phosphate enzyme (YggS family)